MGYIVTLLTIICIYTILTAAMDLILGYAGLFSFVHAALCGIGSYAAAALMVKLGWGLVPALGVALVVTALIAWATAGITVRLEGHYFILGTFCVANVVESVMENWTDVTNGTSGLYGIPVTRLFGWTDRFRHSFPRLLRRTDGARACRQAASCLSALRHHVAGDPRG